MGAVLIGLAFSAASMGAPPTDLPLTYSYNTAMEIGDGRQVLQVHHGKDVSVAKLHTEGESGFYANGDEPFAWAQSYTWVTGAPTDGRLARYQNVGKKILQVREIEPLEPGVIQEPSSRRDAPWAIENLEVSMQPGDRDMTVAGVEASHYVVEVNYEKIVNPGTDAEKRRPVAGTRHLWFDAQRPFSPLQTLPLQMSDSLFVTYEDPAIQEGIFLSLRDRMKELGMLVRMEMAGRDGQAHAFAVERIERAGPLNLADLDAVPIFTDSQADSIAGPMFMSEMVRDSLDEQGLARIDVPRSDGEPIEVNGSAGFTTMDSGDFALAMTFAKGNEDGGTRGMLLLLRPYHGQPEPGRHGMSHHLGRAALDEMSAEEIETHARDFQALGVMRDGDDFLVLTEAVDGEVTLERSDAEGIIGEYRLEMTVMANGGSHTREVRGSFDAPPGDIGRFNHPAGRLIEQKRGN
ncbi:MAG: hypothetical protein ACQER6_09630 [Pseudomonadota bacterium]